jgi:alkyl hydroperoxide reductase subunit D
VTVSALEVVRQTLPESAKDIRLNIQSVLEGGALSTEQKWGVAAACAIASRNLVLRDAIVEDAREQAGEAVVDDARAAAVLMGMNNVYYRFRHMVGKPTYAQKAARLRMQRIAQPATNKLDFELLCLAVSAINGCEACVKAHEHAVVTGGLTEEHVHDAVRIAAVVHAAAVALEA